MRDYSPKPDHRRQSAGVTGEDSRSTLEQPDLSIISSTLMEHLPQSLNSTPKKPLAMVRPRQIISSIRSSSDDYRRFYGGGPDIDCHSSNLRECRSLDPFPSHLRRRIDCIKLPNLKLRNRSSHSLDAGVSTISQDPSGITDSDLHRIAYPEPVPNDNEKRLVPYNKHINNNCNGSVGTEDANCPLLFRQGSLNSPHDEILLQHKRWRSLETVGQLTDNDSNNKKGLNRGIRSWLVGLFQGNGLRSSDASLRKVGVMQSGVRGISGFGELPPAPEHESIV